jgi:signal transduction histidine kinase/ligand-binding sensor domain-containing protein
MINAFLFRLIASKPAKWFLPGFLFLTFANPTKAQQVTRLFCHHVSPQAGLSSSYVRKTLRDPLGWIWAGTDDGLNRYDGRNIIVYNKGLPSPHSLTGTDIWDMSLDTAHSLVWCISSYGGIDAIDYRTGNTVYSYAQSRRKEWDSLRFTSIAISGSFVYLGSTNGLFRLDIRNKVFTRLPIPTPFGRSNTPFSIDKLFVDTAGLIWVFCNGEGVMVLQPGATPTLKAQLGGDKLNIPNHTYFSYFDCCQGPDGTLLVATVSGLRRLRLQPDGTLEWQNNPYRNVPLSAGREIYSCRIDRKGNSWFSASGVLVEAFATTIAATHPAGDTGDTPARAKTAYALIHEHNSRDEGRWLESVYNISFDKDDNLWLGCQQGLLYAQNKPAAFTSIYRSSISETTISLANCLYPVTANLLYCCAQGGLFRVDPIKGTIDPLITAKPFYHACTDPFGRLLVSNSEGAYLLEGGRLVPLAAIYSEFGPLEKLTIDSHCQVGDSLLLLGTLNMRGVVAWNYKRRTAFLINQKSPNLFLQENTVNALYTDKKGLVWVLGNQSITILDLAKKNTQSVNTYNANSKTAYSIFFDICELGDRYLISSYGYGILILDAQYHFVRQLTTRDGLAANTALKLLPYRDSLLFVTSNNGLSALDLRHDLAIRNYYVSDGLRSDYFDENSGAVANGIIYAGGVDGITVIDPALFAAAPKPPQLSLRRIQVQTTGAGIDTTDTRLTSFSIPNDAVQTTLYFSAFNYPNPERTTFSYRIRQLNAGWIENGKLDFINFVGQNPGTYTLEVRAANADGIWSQQPLVLTLSFQPKWYQTLWCKLGILLLVAAGFYCLYRYRLLQLHKQHQIRKDIASDLHDDIGSTLNSVKIFAHLAMKDREKEPHLERIEHSLAEASAGLRDLIWVLDDTQDNVQELLDRLKKFALPVCHANNIEFRCVVAGDLAARTLSKNVKRNLLLILKEAINNSFKYATCTHIELGVDAERNKLIVTVRDNGKGFVHNEITPGYGLKNIRQRAVQIRFGVFIHSAPGEGTSIVLKEK